MSSDTTCQFTDKLTQLQGMYNNGSIYVSVNPQKAADSTVEEYLSYMRDLAMPDVFAVSDERENDIIDNDALVIITILFPNTAYRKEICHWDLGAALDEALSN